MQKDSSNFLSTDVSFSAHNLLAVAISARVDLYKLKQLEHADEFDELDSIKPTHQLFKFKDMVSCVSFR